MGRSISLFSGGNCFGVGVIVSLLYDLGQWPTLSPVLMMLDTEEERKVFNYPGWDISRCCGFVCLYSLKIFSDLMRFELGN